MYARVAKFIGNRKELTHEKFEDLEEIVMDSTKVQAIFEAARVSMGVSVCKICPNFKYSLCPKSLYLG